MVDLCLFIFTLYNKRKGLARVQERLDRVLANSDWCILFPDAMVQHLPRLHSDHCPILLCCEPDLVMDRSQRPLRFQSMWFSHEGFLPMVTAASLYYSHQLQMLEIDLLREYNQILEQEETFWAQKSRVQWLQQGEKNTRFFHLSTICRRRRNRISILRDDDGEWVTENAPLQALVLNYYRGLYANE